MWRWRHDRRTFCVSSSRYCPPLSPVLTVWTRFPTFPRHPLRVSSDLQHESKLPTCVNRSDFPSCLSPISLLRVKSWKVVYVPRVSCTLWDTSSTIRKVHRYTFCVPPSSTLLSVFVPRGVIRGTYDVTPVLRGRASILSESSSYSYIGVWGWSLVWRRKGLIKEL